MHIANKYEKCSNSFINKLQNYILKQKLPILYINWSNGNGKGVA